MAELKGLKRLSLEETSKRKVELRERLKEALGKLDSIQAEIHAIEGAIQEADLWFNTVKLALQEEEE